MIMNLFLTIVMLSLILIYQRRELRAASSKTRWLTYLVLGLSGAIWIYLSTVDRVVYLSVWLNNLLQPFDPIRGG